MQNQTESSVVPGWRACLVAITTIALAAGPSAAQQARPRNGAPGATVESLLALVSRQTPEIAMRVLEAQAALAKVDAAGALPEPTVRVEIEDISTRPGSLRPRRVGMLTYSVIQEFVLWGKRDLQRDIARIEANQAKSRAQQAELEVRARVKSLFARYFATHEAIRATSAVNALLGRVAEISRRHYSEGLGTQQDALKAEIESAKTEAELATLDGLKRQLAGQINALLDRPFGAPLAAPVRLWAMPAVAKLTVPGLLSRAQAVSPELASRGGEIRIAQNNRKLVERSWYPDPTLGVSAVDRDRRFSGYEFMLEFKVPLAFERRAAQAREAEARIRAAEAGLSDAILKLRGELEEAVWSLAALRRTEALTRARIVGPSEVAVQGALAAYEARRIDFVTVLDSVSRARQARLDLLKIQVEQRQKLATIERLIGEEL